jgi:hypothetical protein
MHDWLDGGLPVHIVIASLADYSSIPNISATISIGPLNGIDNSIGILLGLNYIGTKRSYTQHSTAISDNFAIFTQCCTSMKYLAF